MRRSLQSFIVALLCLTLGIDSAKACWLRRHRCRSTAARHATCRPATECIGHVHQVEMATAAYEAATPASRCTPQSAEMVTLPAECHAPASDDCCHPAECCTAAGAAIEVVAETSTVVAVETAVTEAPAAVPADGDASIIVHGPTVVVDAAEPQPGAAPAAQDLLPVPQPAPPPTSVVTPASGERPSAEAPAAATDGKLSEQPAEKPAEPLVMPAPPAANAEPAAAAPVPPAPAASLAVTPPPRPNLFDLYADADEPVSARPVRPEAESPVAPATPATPEAVESTDAATTPEPPMKKEAAPVEATEPADEPAQPATDADKPATTPDQPVPEAKQPQAEPGDPQPEAPAVEAAEPAVEDAAAGSAAETADATSRLVPAEQQRLWTDASGAHQALGWLVQVDTDRVRILKTSGRHTTVAIDSLSAADRDYVALVAARLAAETHDAPHVDATAGL
jgi:hypothetical protein